MAYSGIKTKKNKNGTDNIYVTFKYLNTRYAEKNFTKLFGCNTEAKAFQKLQWIKLEISEGRDPFVVVKETLNDLYDEWLEINLSNGEWRKRTAETYNFFYNKYIRDKVGKKNITKIKVSELQDIYDKDMKDIKAYSRVQMKKILNPLFRRAIMKGLIKKNIISEMIFIKNLKKEREKVSERLNESFLDVVRKLYSAIPHFSGYRKETKEEVRMFLRRNEKFGLLKTSENYDTIGVCKRFFKMDCKKALRSARSVKV